MRSARVSASVSSCRLMAALASRQFAGEGALQEGLAEFVEVAEFGFISIYQ